MAYQIAEGQVLAGKYRVERVLGRGGMGIVVAAQHLDLGERVAIKVLFPEVTHEGEAVKRFVREARTGFGISSEHVVRVLDLSSLDSGQPYIVMEYLEGEDLATKLRRDGPLSMEQAVEFVMQASIGIGEAHRHGSGP